MPQQYHKLKEEARALLLKGCYRIAYSRYKDLLGMAQGEGDRHIINTNLGIALHFQERLG